MRQTLNKLALPFSMGVLASILVHGIIVSVLVVGLSIPEWETEEPEAIEVELVPPPEKAEEEDQVAEEEKLEVEDQLAEEEKLEEEEKKAPEPVLQPEKALSGNQAAPPPPQTLRPVQKFADKDAGSGEAEDIEATNDAEDKLPTPEKPMERQAAQEPIMSAPESPESVPEPAPDGAPEAEETAEIKERMASETDNESDVATVAIGDLSRGIRAGELCATELRSQLRNAIPSYWPDLLPAYRLDEGNVLQVQKGAFRANGRWYNLKFRCEVDDAATQVVSFDFGVGAPVPRSDWARRGLPSS